MPNTYYRIFPDRVELVSEAINEVPISDEVLQRYSVEKPCKIQNIFRQELIGVGLLGNPAVCVKGKLTTVTLRLSHLPVHTKFNAKDGILTPDFASASTASTLLNIPWEVPHNMRLYLLIQVDASNLLVGDSWIVAFDSAGRCYRLPTSNTYEDGKICQGKYDGYGSSLMECATKAYNQFLASQWNADLSDRGGSYGMKNSIELFKFKALEPDGFETIPVENWMPLSTKINSEFINSNIVLI